MKMYQDEENEDEKDSFDEYSTRDEPQQPSFSDRYGYDERDRPPEEEEDDVNKTRNLEINKQLPC